jgi:hypothetical protein
MAKILIVKHGQPTRTIESLTKSGWVARVNAFQTPDILQHKHNISAKVKEIEEVYCLDEVNFRLFGQTDRN